MEINELAAIGHGLATVLFASLAIFLLGRWKNRPKAPFIAAASAATAVWAATQAVGSLGLLNSSTILLVVEWLRNLSWLGVLISIFRDLDVNRRAGIIATRIGGGFMAAATVLTAYYGVRSTGSISMIGVVVGGVMLSTFILILIEQVYRNSPFDARSGLKYFCVGIAGIYSYDLVVFTLTIVRQEMDVDQWAMRGFVSALFAIPLTFGARRSFRLLLDGYVPRQILFYFFSLIGLGMFVVVMLIGDYYVQTYAGTWTGVMQILIFVSAVLFFAVLMVSETVRGRVRVFLTKSFFQYKYDYRKEWLRFIGTLTESERGNVSITAVRAVAQIVNSPGGIVWIQEQDGRNYIPVGVWETEPPAEPSVDEHSSLLRFLRRRQWVVDLNEYRQHPARYDGLELEPWLSERDAWWLVVPLYLRNCLFGFIILDEPPLVPALNFEDHDLLRTVGGHVATHIDQAESDRRLAESGQFGAYNRLTAFLMHDLNNLIAQQSLVVKNAEKFRHNPDFVDDAISTIANSVSRMRRLMEQLSSGSKRPTEIDIELNEVLEKAIRRCEAMSPKPRFRQDDGGRPVKADPDRLTAVIEHLLRNAQDATDDDGDIEVSLRFDDSGATISIRDSGCGMTAVFVRERLFRPFDSTKGTQSMGIGAYQAREYIRQIGGQLDVVSSPGSGTTFDIRLPLP